MPRRTIEFGKNRLYHAYNRGFKKESIFANYVDRDFFIDKMRFYSKKFNVFIESDAVQGNHYHFIIKQLRDTGTQEFLSRLQLTYALYYNEKYKRRGQVFEGRYNAVPIIDMKYRQNIYNYVLYNPLKHREK